MQLAGKTCVITCATCGIRRVAAGELAAAAAEARIDILIDTAGTLFSYRRFSGGVERHFAVNHLPYVVLTLDLSESLLRRRPK
jgi:NAD(P)-dependent dehydrogenase (short-subunit alcohol dehydrogenase family)